MATDDEVLKMMRIQKSVENETTNIDHHHFLHLTNKTDTHSQNFADFSVMEGECSEQKDQQQIHSSSSESLVCDAHLGKRDLTLDAAGELVKAGYKEHMGEIERVSEQTNARDFEQEKNQQKENNMILQSILGENHKLAEISLEQKSVKGCEDVMREYGNKVQEDCDGDMFKNEYNICGDQKREFGKKVIEGFDGYVKGKVDEEPGDTNTSYEDKLREKFKLGEGSDQEYRHRNLQFDGKAVHEFKDAVTVREDAKVPDIQPSPDFPDSDSNKGWDGCPGEEGCDSDWDWERGRPTGERWPPLGAPNDDEDNLSLCSYSELSWQRNQHNGGDYRGSGGRGPVEEERLQQLEEEQEQLNNSLMALTSHFAQVQFRLKQIVDAGPGEKEELLQQLEEFANRGIPDLREAAITSRSSSRIAEDGQESPGGEGLGAGVGRQKELISRLKQQLEDLENYVYESGQGGPPQSSVMEKQRVIIEQLKGKLNLNMDEFDKLTVEDLRVQVDHAIRELVNPLKMKEQLVAQLQTQITDLERFIDFLQDEGPALEQGKKKRPGSACKCEEQTDRHPGDGKTQEGKSRLEPRSIKKDKQASEKEQLRQETENLVQRATTLMKMLTFGCGAGRARFRSNTLKKTPCGNHYGDMRAKLEMAINSVLEVIGSLTPEETEDSTTDDASNVQVTSIRIHQHPQLTAAVRKALAPTLRDLIQHGLMPVGQSQSLVPFLSCFPSQHSEGPTKLLHAWDLILRYYHLHNGQRYNHTPARSLSQSFNLEITGGKAVTNKQNLLAAVGSIISSHTPLKRSYDAHFKAFVSTALNQKKLITWLRLIFRTQSLTENFYQPWSYVAQTGFEDAFRSLDRLTCHNFNLPVDLAVRPFHNIRDAF
ncbi:hypothetical protein Pcinc_008687 [Petrolisthes cinctipes]|uniref:RUN domain-containing protein n=1 Tax=Petrolisthes cinctipes TaxID=88211 RepID=A0AAE1G8G1_PETCI|nr:hypothetical protein Pcinc_008687 [Petrolisthes cinctipes]